MGSADGADPAALSPTRSGRPGTRRSIASSRPTSSPRTKREPALVSDALFARRVHLDIWGLLPAPEALQRFVADRAPNKREALVTQLLADGDKYADHWVSFWNDLLRNEDGVSYFSETAGRKSITEWLVPALQSNLRYDEFVGRLINPAAPGDPEGFLIGVNWRGETSAAVTPWMQASQNTAQVFLGVNLKCTSCHDSFVNRWKLKDAYGLAAYFSPEPRLQMYRCDVAQDKYAEPGFIFPELRARRRRRARRSPRRGCRHLHRSAARPDAADVRQPHLAAPPRPRHRRQRRRDGRRAVEPGAARLARERLRRQRLRHQAA